MKTINFNHFLRKQLYRTIIYSVLVLLSINLGCTQESKLETEDKCLSPYFFVQSESGMGQMPLKSTSAEVNIAGVIADVRINQVYKNEGFNTLEAIYIFPASTRAAVHYMKMKIDDRVIVATVQQKDQARQTYEQAKQEGKVASLLEQKRPNVFQMNVANIMPGATVEVELNYTELLLPEERVYEFVYPTVVGPRYSNQTAAEAPNDTWVSNPYFTEGKKTPYTFDIKVNIEAGLPLYEIRSSSHDVDIVYDDPKTASIGLKSENEFSGNKDFILQYRLAENKIETGLLLYEGKDENYFLAMIQPPKRIEPDMIPSREYVFIIDISGSMYGYPLDISKNLMKSLLGQLRPQDRFNLLLFAGSSSLYAEKSLPATPSNIQNAISHIDNQQGGGGTELSGALKRALALEGTEDYSRTFVILTDGYISFEKEAFELISDNLSNANFFAFGIGSSVNRYLIEGIAHTGMGEPFVVTDPNEAAGKAKQFERYISTPVLTNISIQYNGLTTYGLLPEKCPDVFAERPVIITGKFKGDATGEIILKGRSGNTDYTYKLDVSKASRSETNKALKYLWAREKIKLLSDYSKAIGNQELIEQITDLGLKYNLLTEYTSFVAVDTKVSNTTGNITIVNLPLPLPEGVSNYAVGGQAIVTGYGTVNKRFYTKSVMSPACEKSLAIVGDEMTIESNETELKEDQPEYQGGIEAFKNYILKNIQYPAELNGNNIHGEVIIEINIGSDGKILKARIIKGLHPSLDNEIIRIVKNSPKWNIYKANNDPVQVSITIPSRK